MVDSGLHFPTCQRTAPKQSLLCRLGYLFCRHCPTDSVKRTVGMLKKAKSFLFARTIESILALNFRFAEKDNFVPYPDFFSRGDVL